MVNDAFETMTESERLILARKLHPETFQELDLLREVCSVYADDEDRFLSPASGEPYGSVSTEVGMTARVARMAFRRTEAQHERAQNPELFDALQALVEPHGLGMLRIVDGEDLSYVLMRCFPVNGRGPSRVVGVDKGQFVDPFLPMSENAPSSAKGPMP